MLDRFDLKLLNLVQRDDGRTADSLASDVALSSSAIARRLRRLRRDGWIARTIALLSPRLTARRLRAIVLVQLSEHADHRGIDALVQRLAATPQVQFAVAVAGPHDIVLLIDCGDMEEFTSIADRVLVADPTVRRYETSFVKRELKFAPFVDLAERP
ncbi:Lrp/AsnC family transcriptional regulator [Sphingomonas sabuli]|uniref:Lrp/AsnC family transcriptional regulator n=1 Tax=Sphingomonas sabuli TaxID=2764186 RepID=A0A7G9L0X3_9SPHN|nr:Lrp/AsnC family transcriptional regulator [Sphingomonas sabuli]QNM82272.1 Lrp/AsnC family transcriptional regulator [Sphingomonas sabuli]